MNISFMDKYNTRNKYEEMLEYERWDREIPFIPFKSGWQVAPRPNFGGAVVRFKVRRADTKPNDFVSIYLDCYDEIGIYGAPYWEIHPVGEDVSRVGIQDVEGLLDAIETSLNQISTNKNEGR